MNEYVTDNRRDLLLVIDMQNAYTSKGPWYCPSIDKATGNIISLIESDRFDQIIFTRFDAAIKPVGTWRQYNEINREVNEDAYLNQIVEPLLPYISQHPLYSKSTYSSLTVPEIREAVERCISKNGSVVLTGVVSECCVLASAFQAIDMGAYVTYIRDGCAGVNEQTENSVIEVLKGLDYVQTRIVDTQAYLNTDC
ncbi:MAG: cysteine hydrolase [Erysipelotrichaceae bacterium]|nr:cysteine hydrolase [Erysipelotrichaceae bacterium]